MTAPAMADLLSQPNSFVQNYGVLRNLLSASGPEGWRERRERAFRAFEAVGIPTHRDEEFRYLSLRSLEEEQFLPAYGATVERDEVAQTPLGSVDAITLSFVNGQYAPELSSADILPEGVFVGSLADGWEAVPAALEAHLGNVADLSKKLGSTNDERFAHLNTAFLDEGAVVVVPRGIALERPIHLQFLTKADHGALAAFPRVLVVLEEAAQAKVIESYTGLGGRAFASAVTELVLAKNAILEVTRFVQEGPETIHISTSAAHQEEGSTLIHTAINLGGKIVRNDLNIWGGGEHTETSLNGVNVGTGDEVIDNHTRIDHATPNCHSFETYKSVLKDHSVGVFNGKIFVYLDAQKTDAKQTNQALLLSPTATMNSKPQLEIFADDVKCTHGATIGQLREDALFYLRARGIPKSEAEALLVFAFAAEVIEKVSVDEVREALEAVLFAKLGH